MSRKNENSSIWKVLGALAVGALVGIGAGIIGSEVAKDEREKDLLNLRSKSKVLVKTQKKEEQQGGQDIHTQIESFYCPITQ